MRNGFVDRNGENEFARFFRGLDVFFEKGHAFDAALLEKFGRDVAQRESELIVFLKTVEIAVAQVAGFLRRDDFFHQNHRRIVLARILRAFGLHNSCADGEVGGLEAHDERVTPHGAGGETLIAHAAHHHAHAFVERQGETPRGIGLHTVAATFGRVVKHIDKRNGFAALGIDHATHEALCRKGQGSE